MIDHLQWTTVGFAFHDFAHDGKSSFHSACHFTIEAMYTVAMMRMRRRPWHISFNEQEYTNDTITVVFEQMQKNCRSKRGASASGSRIRTHGYYFNVGSAIPSTSIPRMTIILYYFVIGGLFLKFSFSFYFRFRF